MKAPHRLLPVLKEGPCTNSLRGRKKPAVIFSTHSGKGLVYRLRHVVQNQVFVFFYLCQFTKVSLYEAIKMKKVEINLLDLREKGLFQPA